MKQVPPTAGIALQLGGPELQQIISTVEENVLQKIQQSPEKFFPSSAFKVKLYSTEEVSKHLRISEATVRNLCNEGRLKHLRPSGRNIFVSQEQLEQYLESIKSE